MITNTAATLGRRTLLGLGAASAAGLALGGCSKTPAKLRVAWYGPDAVSKAVNAALTAWTSSGGAAVTAENTLFAGYWDKLATETAGGNAPDLMRMSMSYFSDYASRGSLLDLAGLPIDTSKLDKGVASSGMVGSTNYGIGQSSISQAIYVDEAALAKVGAKVPAAGWTWDAFAEFATGYASQVKGSYGTSDQAGNLQIFEVWARQAGTDLFSPDGKQLTVAVDTIQAWFEYWAKLRAGKGVPSQSVTGETGTVETSLLATGKAPVQFGWVQQVTFYQPLVKSPLSVLGVPQKTAGDLSGQFVKGLDLWCISAKTKLKDEAAKVMNFLLNDPAAIKALGLSLGVPPSKAARDEIKANADTAAARAIDYIEAISDKVGASPAPWPVGYGQCLTEFTRIAQDIGFGKSDPAKGAADFVTTAKQALGAS